MGKFCCMYTNEDQAQQDSQAETAEDTCLSAEERERQEG